MNKITMLGTGNATVTQIYNTCFVLATDTTRLLVDAGGGNGILSQLMKVDFPIPRCIISSSLMPIPTMY